LNEVRIGTIYHCDVACLQALVEMITTRRPPNSARTGTGRRHPARVRMCANKVVAPRRLGFTCADVVSLGVGT